MLRGIAHQQRSSRGSSGQVSATPRFRKSCAGGVSRTDAGRRRPSPSTRPLVDQEPIVKHLARPMRFLCGMGISRKVAEWLRLKDTTAAIGEEGLSVCRRKGFPMATTGLTILTNNRAMACERRRKNSKDPVYTSIFGLRDLTM